MNGSLNLSEKGGEEMADFLGHVWYPSPTEEGKGHKVGVNWYRKGRLGISFLTSVGQRASESKVLDESDVEFKYGTLEEQEEKKDVRDEDYDDLRERLKEIRQERKAYDKRNRKKTKTKKKKKKSKPKKEKDPLEVLKDMDPEAIKKALGDING